MSLALVDQLNFEKQMPIDGNCSQEFSISVPSTGSGDYYAGSYFLINIPRASHSHVFDPMNSFLRFQACNLDAGQTCVVNHSAESFIQKVEILHAGNVLETIDNYATLGAIMLDCQVEPSVRNTSLNMTQGCSGTYAAIAGPTLNKSGAGSTAFYSLTLHSGICGSLCRSYIPVFELQGSLQLRITFANSNQFGAWAAAPTTTSNSNFKFNNIEFHANMIKLSEPILEMVKAQNYTNIQKHTLISSKQLLALYHK